MGSRAHLCPCPAYVTAKSEEFHMRWLMQPNKGLFWSWLGLAKSCFETYSLDSPSARPGSAAPSCSSLPGAEAGPRSKLWAWWWWGTSRGKAWCPYAHQCKHPAPFYGPAQGIWGPWRLEIWGPRDNEIRELNIWKCLCLKGNSQVSCTEKGQTYHMARALMLYRSCLRSWFYFTPDLV